MNSTKSIVEKLNLGKYPTKLIINKPSDIEDFNETVFDSAILKEKYDLIIVFVFNLDDLSKYLRSVIDKQLLECHGYLYFAYPKKGNQKYDVYIDRDSLFTAITMDEEKRVQDSNLKYSKMVSLNDIFTVIGLKSEVKKTAKATEKSIKSSQCVDDYIENIEDIKHYLSKNKEIQDNYMGLSLGYQKDWARHIYSAKKKETQEKRLKEMETVLAEGYKSLDLYKRDKK